MRHYTPFLLFFLFSSTAFCQDLAMASETGNEPLLLLKQAHLSLDAGNTRLAINIFEKVIEFYEHEGRQKEVPENYLGMALALAFNGNYHRSIQYHKKALRAHRKYKGRESAEEIRINLGLTYQLAGKDRKAKKYFKV